VERLRAIPKPIVAAINGVAELLAESKKTAEKLAKMPTKGLALTKQALNKTWANNLTEQLAVEDELQYAASLTYDYGEGVKAFIEKRKPVFKGE